MCGVVCAPRSGCACRREVVGGGGGSERRRVGGVTEPRALRITLGELRLQLHELRSNRSRAGRVGAGGWSQATSHTGIPCCNRCACRQSRSARVHVEKHRAQHCLHQFPPAPPQPARINSLCSRSRHRRSRHRRRRQDAARTGSTGIVRSRQKCFTEARLGVFRRSWSLQVRVDKRGLLCSSTPPCPASEARQMERGTSRARASEPSKASASSRPISKAPKASSTSVSTAQRRAGARKIRRKGSVARRLPGSVPACASGAPEKLL